VILQHASGLQNPELLMPKNRQGQPTNRHEPVLPHARTFSLSKRQSEVLNLAARGLSGKQIARELKISPRTVADHFSRLRQRTGAHSQAELIVVAVAAGFLEPRSLLTEGLSTHSSSRE
jgi:DNA-binding NarL/FixJ family response regulator